MSAHTAGSVPVPAALAAGEGRPAVGPQAEVPRPLAYLGPEGTFTERALRTLPEAAHSPLSPVTSAQEALAQIRTGTAGAAMLPVHNTVGGAVPDTVRALAASSGLEVRQEVVLSIRFALLSRPGVRLGEVRTVTGHPHARAQVRRWLDGALPYARWVSSSSNGAGALWVRDGLCDAAVAGEFTATRYGLEVVAAGIQDHPGAVTRFFLVAPVAEREPRRAWGDLHRTSLIGLFDGPEEQARAALARLCAHPSVRRLSAAVAVTGHGGDRSALLVDLPGPGSHPEVSRAVEHLCRGLPELRPLGSYPVQFPHAPTSVHRSVLMHPDQADIRPAGNSIADLRTRVDALDSLLIETLRRRLTTSEEIQRIRTGGGGTRVDPWREQRVRGRYTEAFGPGGDEMAEAMLRLCRGRSPR